MSHSTSISEATIKQGTPEWHEWRAKHLGGSEIAAVMGESEYDTPLSLWRVRTGRAQAKVNNFAMQTGNEQEAKIRALYELETGVDAPPILCQHPDLVWAGCSLDGWLEDRIMPVEMKCFGAEKHAMVKAGVVPPGYKAQLQWQMFVTGAKACHFVSLDMATLSDLVILPVTIDLEYQGRMIAAAMHFWGLIQTDTPPPLTDRDALEVTDPVVSEAFQHWKTAKLMGESAAQKLALEAARAEIETLTKTLHPKLICEGVRASLVQRKNGPSVTIQLVEAKA